MLDMHQQRRFWHQSLRRGVTHDQVGSPTIAQLHLWVFFRPSSPQEPGISEERGFHKTYSLAKESNSDSPRRGGDIHIFSKHGRYPSDSCKMGRD